MEESFSHKITVEEIRRFSSLVSDFHPLHCDPEYAVKNGFPGVLAQGFLIASLASSLVSMRLPGENTLIVSSHFTYHQPIYPEETLTFKGRITSLEKRFSLATIDIVVLSGNEKKSSGKIEIKVRT